MRVSRSFRPLPTVLGLVLLLGLAGAGLLAAAAAGALTFAPEATYETAPAPWGIATGDFDDDGRLDLATVSATQNTMSILPGDGRGGFGAPTDFPTGERPYGVAVGDLNGDGKLDAVTVDSLTPYVSVFLGDGTGGFAPATRWNAGFSGMGVLVDDVNGDGHQDIIAANFSSFGVSVVLGTGTGSFLSPVYLATGGFTRGIAVADFNEDGAVDLVSADYAGTATVLLGDGAGGFGAGIILDVGAGPWGVAAGDYDGDGHQDFAVSAWEGDSVGVRYGDGAGGFGDLVSLPMDCPPLGIVAGDYDGDGIQDVAVAGDGATTVFLGGAGGLTPATDISGGSFPMSICSGDFDRDGKVDLARAAYFGTVVGVLLGVYEQPHGAMRLSGGAAATATRAVTVDAGVAEASWMRVRAAGGVWGDWTGYVHRAAWTLPAGDGPKTVEAQYAGSAGMTEVLTDTILLDTTAPETTDDAPRGWATSPSVTVMLEPDDGSGSGVARTQYKVDDAASWSEGTSVVVSGDGVHTLRYRSVDTVGNVEETRFALVRADATAPEADVSGVDDAWHRAPVLALLAATDATSGVAGASWKLDAGAWTPGWAVLVSADGDHVLQYRASDVAGNQSEPQAVHVRIDTRGPVTSGKAARARRGKKATFSVQVSDLTPTATVTIVIKSRAGKTLKRLPAGPQPTGVPVRITWRTCRLHAGTYRYVVRATDAAGNRQTRAGGNRLVVR